MRILLTGATGFIGSHLARLLISQGYNVYALIREQSNLWRIDDLVPHLTLIRCDLDAFEELRTQLKQIRPEVCIHAAWYVVPGQYLTAAENLNLISASLHLASELAKVGCQRFIGLGTCFEYNTDLGYLSEESATRPQTLYAASKLALRTIFEQWTNGTTMKIAWLRLFYLYGPFEKRQRLVPTVIYTLLQNQISKVTYGQQIRDFLHVSDAAAAIWAVAQNDISGTVNIGSGQPISVQEIVTKIGVLLNRTELIALGALPYHPSDPMFICANNHRLVENTNWTPKYNLESGLEDTIKWWQKHLGIA